MPRSLVFINTRSDASEMVKALTKVNGVSEAHSSRGVYDAVAMVQPGSLSQVKDIGPRGFAALTMSSQR